MGLPVWPLILGEEHELKVFENTVLRGLFGPKRDKSVGDWRKLHNEELHDTSSPNIIRMMKRRIRRAGNVACMERKTNALDL
jgi:hypothetical protein